MIDCTRAVSVFVCSLAVLAATAPQATAQSPAQSNFNIYVNSAQVGTEQITVTQDADGWTISETGRFAAPLDLVIKEFTARYDKAWRARELTIDSTVRGQASTIHATVSGGSVTAELTGGPGTTPQQRTEAVDPEALFLLNPTMAPFEAVAARLQTATPGTTLKLFQPGQGGLTGLVGPSATERIQTVDRVINARRTLLTLQAGAAPPVDAQIWADETGRLLRLQILSQRLEVVREDMAAVSTRRLTMSRANDEQVRIEANGFSLAGTLSKPEGKTGKLPAVVLISGSGPTDRDEVVSGIAIFGQLADALANAGYIVLRYDKRGVGQSGGRIESATLADYAEDARAAVRFLNERKDVDPRRIGLVGHSEGGSLALLVASKEKRVAGLALVATVGTTGAELNMYQVTHALERTNRPDAERKATLDLQKRIQDAVITGKGWETIAVPDNVRRQADTPYFQSVLTFDPDKVMKDVAQPVLILQGSLDTQVPPSNADKLETSAKARKKGGAVDVVRVQGVNHLLVAARSGEVDEYARLSAEKVSPDVIAALTNWLSKTLSQKP
ncbi:MAG: alpha/beta fold hydrolase [Vicinamibacterales bacterium]